MLKTINKTFLGLLFVYAPNAWADFPLQSHQATYEMTKRERAVENWSSIKNADGVMRYKISNTCDGWTVENHTALYLDYGTGQPVHMTWSYTSFESKTGDQFQFSSRTKRFDEIVENVSGVVERDNGKMVLKYKSGENERVELPSDTIFPTMVMIQSLQQAKSGTPLFTGSYFDGSGEDLDMYVSTFSAPSKQISPKKLVGVELPSSPLWDIDMAFYKPEGQADIPELEIGAKMREDGITLSLFQEFSDFSLDGKLTEIKVFEEPNCN